MARIAQIRQKYRPDGGAERFVASWLQAFGGSAHELVLITRNWPGGDGFQAITCNPPKFPRIMREWAFARGVRRILANEQFDLVQSNERISGCDVFRAGDGVHREWLNQRARVISPFARLATTCSPFHRYTLSAERQLFESPDLRAVICNSQMVADEIQQHFRISSAKLRVVYNCVDTDRFRPDQFEARSKIRADLAIGDDEPVFVFVGSGFARKGLDRAIEAISETAAHLIVVGRDKAARKFMRQAFQAGLEPRVHFVGVQTDVQKWYSAADGLLLPTLYDPFPNVVLEAMASGLPVVTSTKCGGSDFIRSGHEGYVTDALDVKAIRAAILKLSDQTHSRNCGMLARARVEHLTESHMRDELNSLYGELLNERHAAAA